jgi:hypothetical protein
VRGTDPRLLEPALDGAEGLRDRLLAGIAVELNVHGAPLDRDGFAAKEDNQLRHEELCALAVFRCYPNDHWLW